MQGRTALEIRIEPKGEILRFEDDGHPVMDVADEFISLGNDDRAAQNDLFRLPIRTRFPESGKRQRILSDGS